MNAKLSSGIILVALIIGTLYGPLTMLKDVTSDNLTAITYWLDIAAAALRSFATTATALVAVVGAALGLPMWQARKGSPDVPPAPPPA